MNKKFNAKLPLKENLTLSDFLPLWLHWLFVKNPNHVWIKIFRNITDFYDSKHFPYDSTTMCEVLHCHFLLSLLRFFIKPSMELQGNIVKCPDSVSQFSFLTGEPYAYSEPWVNGYLNTLWKWSWQEYIFNVIIPPTLLNLLITFTSCRTFQTVKQNSYGHIYENLIPQIKGKVFKKSFANHN